MKTVIRLLRHTSLVALSCSALALLTPLHVNAGPALQPLADQKAKTLPLAASFEKSTPGENGGPYSARLKNTSDAAVKVSASIIWSVASHNRANTINLPARTIAPGEAWVISDLAAEDRVIVSGEGYEKLELKVPPAKSEK